MLPPNHRSAPRMTPRAWLETPICTPAIPNRQGSSSVYSKTAYSFAAAAASVQIYVASVTQDGLPLLLAEHASYQPPQWLNATDRIIWLASTPSGNTRLLTVCTTAAAPAAPTLLGIFPGPASDLRVHLRPDGNVVVALVATADVDGAVYNPSNEAPKPHSMRYYTSAAVRYWDKWVTPQTKSIFYASIPCSLAGHYGPVSAWFNALDKAAPGLQLAGAADAFDLYDQGICFVARDPALKTAFHTKTDCYVVRVPDFLMPPTKPVLLHTKGLDGLATYPRVSPDGSRLAMLKQAVDGYDADMARPLVFDTANLAQPPQMLLSQHPDWDLTSDSLTWHDNSTLLLTVPFAGRRRLYALNVRPDKCHEPRLICGSRGHIEAVYPYRDNAVMVTLSCIARPPRFVLASAPEPHPEVIEVSEKNEFQIDFELSKSRIDIFVDSDSGDYKVHSLVVRPPGFDPFKRYPVCIMVHGGPQHAAYDTWDNFNQNPLLFAEQGYMVVLPNFTGSCGYSQRFIDAISHDWSGRPYADIRATFAYLRDHVPEADTSRAILGGLSYGGYMTNWIQGSPLGREFKALFTINGIFASAQMLATDEVFFIQRDLGGLPWDSAAVAANYQRADPAARGGNWATPHIIVHSAGDYRVPVENGLAAFNCLQANGVDSALAVFEDESHIIAKPENRLAMYEAILGFCNPKVGLPLP